MMSRDSKRQSELAKCGSLTNDSSQALKEAGSSVLPGAGCARFQGQWCLYL